jgi:hypothetical protein
VGSSHPKAESSFTKYKCPVCGDYHAAEDGIILYVRDFICPNCGEEWRDLWCCDCNDHCPQCNAEIESQPDSVKTMEFEKPLEV